MNPYISVVVPTMRVGGLDVLFEGLQHQTFRDFELVIADGLYKHRSSTVFKHKKSYNFPVTHVEPFDNPFPVASFCRYSNTALVHARGEIVLFVTDYTFLPKDCLAIHADWHKKSQSKVHGLMCPQNYVLTPPHKKSFPCYADEETDTYAKDIVDGKLTDCMWSLFETPFSPNTLFGTDARWGGADPKLTLPHGPVHFNMFHAKNESCKLEVLLDANGWNEAMDGTHNWQDSELADRLHRKWNVTWHLDPTNVACIVNPRHIFPFAKRLRPYQTNNDVFEHLKAIKYAEPVNSWNLRKKRAELGFDVRDKG